MDHINVSKSNAQRICRNENIPLPTSGNPTLLKSGAKIYAPGVRTNVGEDDYAIMGYEPTGADVKPYYQYEKKASLVINKLDNIADGVEKVYPKLALAIDKISDKLECKAATIDLDLDMDL